MRKMISALPQNVRSFREVADRMAAYRGVTVESDNQRLELMLEYVVKAGFDSDPAPRVNTAWSTFTSLAPLYIRSRYAAMLLALASAHNLSPDRFIEVVVGELFVGQRCGDTVEPFLRPAEIARQHTGPRDRNTSAVIADFAANGVRHPEQPRHSVLKDFVGIDTGKQIKEIKRIYPQADEAWIFQQGINAIYWTLFPAGDSSLIDETAQQIDAIKAAGYYDISHGQLLAIAVDTLYQEAVIET